MAKYKIDFHGVDDVLDTLGSNNARIVKRIVDDDLEEGIDRMAERSYEYAPVDTSALKHSILASVTKLSRHHYMYGSHLPYAQRQEYEHKTKKGFFRRSVLHESPEIHAKIASTVKRHFDK